MSPHLLCGQSRDVCFSTCQGLRRTIRSSDSCTFICRDTHYCVSRTQHIQLLSRHIQNIWWTQVNQHNQSLQNFETEEESQTLVYRVTSSLHTTILFVSLIVVSINEVHFVCDIYLFLFIRRGSTGFQKSSARARFVHNLKWILQ
jgi:hypothetical protein